MAIVLAIVGAIALSITLLPFVVVKITEIIRWSDKSVEQGTGETEQDGDFILEMDSNEMSNVMEAVHENRACNEKGQVSST